MRKGLTLLELLLALAILGTVLALAYGAVVQFMQSRSDLDATVSAQAKLRRIVEVFSQDLRSAVLGGIAATPYPSGRGSISFALLEGGAGYPVLPHDSGSNSSFKQAAEAKIVVLASDPDQIGITPGDFVLMVNNAGDGVILPVTQVNRVGGEPNRWHVVHAGCGNTIDYTPNTLLFRVRTLGFRYDPIGRQLVYREGRGDEVDEVPVAFDLDRFELHYVYEAAFGDTVTDPSGDNYTPSYDFTNPTSAPPYQVTQGTTGKVYSLRRLSVTLEASFLSRGRRFSRTYTSQVELSSNQAKRILACR
ncbi:prepilin-type N-terminal cleavage/methylation domain-containing protein [Thermus arciformis]|uniref:Prepilin-type N-terminal cleavage/methylation domain-containing protein n=1 Tax=Thermus arciformis TaxID=482827 RepID=A0A1G7E1V2_9DEIN|nr:prepilin-type N-terminal cleavage/methylation domain-containing protein [Thermus arciformis]SDE57693.1 prepilin-type N-terminal cleavage/methylation domain-containing protein [Thermus arciformis]